MTKDSRPLCFHAPEGDETFALSAEEEPNLLTAIAEADRGETTSASQVLQQIPRS